MGKALDRGHGDGETMRSNLLQLFTEPVVRVTTAFFGKSQAVNLCVITSRFLREPPHESVGKTAPTQDVIPICLSAVTLPYRTVYRDSSGGMSRS